jgi:hypothetical protein
MATSYGAVKTVGSFVNGSGANTAISNMQVVAGGRTVFDGTTPNPGETPAVGGVIRITGTGELTVQNRVGQTIVFHVKFPDGTTVASTDTITVPGAGPNAYYPDFMFEFLILFLNVGQATFDFEVNGMVWVDTDSTFSSDTFSVGPNRLQNVNFQRAMTVDVTTNTSDPGPIVVFDEAVIEYLFPPS